MGTWTRPRGDTSAPADTILDSGANAPPAVAPGSVLVDAVVPSPVATMFTAAGRGRARGAGQSLIAADVTAETRVWVRGPTATVLASGVVLPARVTEQYAYPSAAANEVPSINLSVALYRYLALETAPANALAARNLIRPRFSSAHQALSRSKPRDPARPTAASRKRRSPTRAASWT